MEGIGRSIGGERDEVPIDPSLAGRARREPAPPAVGEALSRRSFRQGLAAGGDRSSETWDRFCSLAHAGDPSAAALVNTPGERVFPHLASAFELGLSDKSLIVRAASIQGIMRLPHEVAVRPLLQGFLTESDSSLAREYIHALGLHRECEGVEDALANALDRNGDSLRSDLRVEICAGGDMARNFEIFRSRFAKAQDREARGRSLADFAYLADLGSEQAAEQLAQVVRTSSDKMERLAALAMLKNARRLSLLTAEQIDEMEEVWRGGK